jgi:hypothetical protein
MQLRYQGLPADGFSHLFGLGDDELGVHGMRRMIVDAKPGFPCRVTLEDAEPGEHVLLLAFEHQPAHSPFRASGPIFVREGVHPVFDRVDATARPQWTAPFGARLCRRRHDARCGGDGWGNGGSASAKSVRCAGDGLCAYPLRAPRLLCLPRGAGIV